MHIGRELTHEAPFRIGATLVLALVALLSAGIALRPDLMSLGMTMAQRLIVGFGL